VSALPRSVYNAPIRLWRGARADDLDAVFAIEQRAYPWPWTWQNLADSLAAGHRFELLSSPQGLMGYSVTMRTVDELHLLNLTVSPDWQGQGHGAALLARLAEDAAAQALRGIWLEVRASNARAMALYARHGYVRINQRRGYYPTGGGPREDAWVMHRNLEAA
jgi:[ribosomal protein S18]-alanine N-acetyltransferase